MTVRDLISALNAIHNKELPVSFIDEGYLQQVVSVHIVDRKYDLRPFGVLNETYSCVLLNLPS